MIGLNRHRVEVVEHHPGWADLADSACQDIQHAAGGLIASLQHVGSTAVPDLPAKPILDIAAGVCTPEAIPELLELMPAIGYLYCGDDGSEGGHLFVKESSPDVRTIHVHVVEHNGTQWRNYLLFRNLLRQDPDIRQQYAELKQELGKQFHNDRKSYTASKHDFIRGILETGTSPAQPNTGEV
ncbi:GrpB family protein [Candidatus Entotheonella palauensis]|uniref:GrpB family protein n=1 Tax=Candidatus Entotheonella palauensis TaxID=93172 RepID=UPI0015C4595B|nr:GrpB family protein [Candidatus Entotheonella palauensis]